ncbi:hypothetical protein [Streptomyces sp. YIM S03343]
MVQPFAVYRDAMREAWGDWWLAWPLLQQVAVGDVFQLADGSVRTAGTLAERRVPFRESPPAARGSFVYDAGGGLDVRFKASGTTDPLFSALADADAGVLVRFARERAALVAYRGLTASGVTDVRDLAVSLIGRYWQGRWDAELLAVTEVVRADAAAVLVAAGAEAAVELRLATSAGAGPVQLVDLAGAAQVAHSRRLGFQWVGDTATPLYRVVRLRRTWLGGVRREFGPPQPGQGLSGEPTPPVLLEEALDDPAAVLESLPSPQWSEGPGAEEPGSEEPGARKPEAEEPGPEKYRRDPGAEVPGAEV